MPLTITPLYAALAALILLVLAVRVIRRRRRLAVGLGSGGDQDLEQAIRCHGNFVEYAPVGLILLASAELGGAPAAAVHAIGVPLIAGRLLHAWGLSQSRNYSFGRSSGMILTIAALVIGIVTDLALALGR